MYSLLSNCVICESIMCQTHQSCVDCQSRQPCHSHYVLATTLPLYTCWSHSDHVSTMCQSCQSHVCHMSVRCHASHVDHVMITYQSYNRVNCLSVTCDKHVSYMSCVKCHVGHMSISGNTLAMYHDHVLGSCVDSISCWACANLVISYMSQMCWSHANHFSHVSCVTNINHVSLSCHVSHMSSINALVTWSCHMLITCLLCWSRVSSMLTTCQSCQLHQSCVTCQSCESHVMSCVNQTSVTCYISQSHDHVSHILVMCQ